VAKHDAWLTINFLLFILTQALRGAAAKVVQDHRRRAKELAVWPDGKAVWISASEAGVSCGQDLQDLQDWKRNAQALPRFILSILFVLSSFRAAWSRRATR
jgi:hypothetical protein